jgi:hypothetical protein
MLICFLLLWKNRSSNNTRIPSPINFVNNFHLELQFAREINDTRVSFLDIFVSINGNQLVTLLLCNTSLLIDIFCFPLPTPTTPKGRFPSLSSFAAFAVKRRTSKSKVRKWDTFCPTWLSYLSIRRCLFEGLPTSPIRDSYRPRPVSNVTSNNKIPRVLTYHLFNFKAKDVIRKNFHILKNDPKHLSFSPVTP